MKGLISTKTGDRLIEMVGIGQMTRILECDEAAVNRMMQGVEPISFDGWIALSEHFDARWRALLDLSMQVETETGWND